MCLKRIPICRSSRRPVGSPASAEVASAAAWAWTGSRSTPARTTAQRPPASAPSASATTTSTTGQSFLGGIRSFTAVSSEAWAKLRVWASVAGRGWLLLSGSVAHASLKTAVCHTLYVTLYVTLCIRAYWCVSAPCWSILAGGGLAQV